MQHFFFCASTWTQMHYMCSPPLSSMRPPPYKHTHTHQWATPTHPPLHKYYLWWLKNTLKHTQRDHSGQTKRPAWREHGRIMDEMRCGALEVCVCVWEGGASGSGLWWCVKSRTTRRKSTIKKQHLEERGRGRRYDHKTTTTTKKKDLAPGKVLLWSGLQVRSR